MAFFTHFKTPSKSINIIQSVKMLWAYEKIKTLWKSWNGLGWLETIDFYIFHLSGAPDAFWCRTKMGNILLTLITITYYYFKLANPDSFYFILVFFNQTLQILQQINVAKMSIEYTVVDSSRCPLDNELSPITTWPGLPIFSNLNFMDKHPTAISVLWVKALKSSPKSKKSPNLVTLIGSGYRVQKYAKTHFQVNKRIKLLGMDLCNEFNVKWSKIILQLFYFIFYL